MEPNDAAIALGQRIREQRESRNMSLDVFYAEVCTRLPRSLWPSTETIRRIEKGVRLPEPTELAAIADTFGVTVGDLAPELIADAQAVRELFERTVTMLRWIWENPAQGTLFPDLLVAA